MVRGLIGRLLREQSSETKMRLGKVGIRRDGVAKMSDAPGDLPGADEQSAKDEISLGMGGISCQDRPIGVHRLRVPPAGLERRTETEPRLDKIRTPREHIREISDRLRVAALYLQRG